MASDHTFCHTMQDTAGYDQQIDIYSVGILAMETFTGRNPYAGMANLHVRLVDCITYQCLLHHA